MRNSSKAQHLTDQRSKKQVDRSPSVTGRPKLLDQLRHALHARHYSRRTEQAYVTWVKRFIFFHNVRHPAEMGEPEINAFLTHLAVKERVSASTQNQALGRIHERVSKGVIMLTSPSGKRRSSRLLRRQD